MTQGKKNASKKTENTPVKQDAKTDSPKKSEAQQVKPEVKAPEVAGRAVELRKAGLGVALIAQMLHKTEDEIRAEIG